MNRRRSRQPRMAVPEPDLLENTRLMHQKGTEVVDLIEANIQRLQNLGCLKMVEALLGADERLKWALHHINLLMKAAGKYTVGDELTLIGRLPDARLLSPQGPQVTKACHREISLQNTASSLQSR